MGCVSHIRYEILGDPEVRMAFDEYGGLDPEAESFDSFAQCLLRNIVSEPRASCACFGPVSQFALWTHTAKSAVFHLQILRGD